MSKSDRSKLHIAMFPWVAYGHIIPFLHLSNKLAHKGHKISFLLPKGVQPELENMSQFPNLIQFFPLVLPQVDGLSPGAETTRVVPSNQQKYLFFAVDQTRDQVESIFKVLKPDMVFYDTGFWIPDLARQLGISPVFYVVTSPMIAGMMIKPKKLTMETTLEEAIELPPGYPSSTVRFKVEEAPALLVMAEDVGSGLSLQERMNKIMIGSDAVAFRSHRELEGPFLDYFAQETGKLVLLSGPCLPETKTQQLDDKWVTWLSQFEPGSVVFCAFGSESELQKDEFQELILGFELCGLPFLVALKPPKGCSTVEEALPEGFKDRVKGRGLVYSDWVPQKLLLNHPNIGCFVNHCGYGSMWEFLLSDCQIVLIPQLPDQILNTRWMVNDLKIGVEVERGKNRQVSKESFSEAINFVMDKENETAKMLRANHAKLKQTLCSRDFQEEYINNFIQALQDLVKK
ncbi:putative UDP-Glycosyltransferase superfamily protein [Hibiscus syriacus]|uniref:UDP-Glycosyltransferase superfamily protein n=1 Tax=Hibiscus syriacus TaxID=106335 RepID=A0A6A3AHM4_HIBSY|nr:UDP-glycosyltransferase 79B2-like [Hibiscus syriacus]KAE8703283.1 putative UDP-Glycosyltransferase superfamily protein [Hibiscus syriacus]